MSVRLVLRALLVEARMTGGLIVGFGVRNTGLTGGRGRQTVADVLVRLREEDDPLIDLVAKGTGEDPDVYRLRIPEAYRGQALSRPWRAGRIEAGHPVFLHLGGVAGLVYEALSSVPARPTELERAVVLSSSAVSAALRHLAEVGLAEKAVDDDGARGWRRGPATLDEVAARGDVQADDLFAERVRIVQAERREYREFLRLMGDPAHWRGVAERALAEQAAGEQEPDAPAVVDLTAHDTGGPRPDWVPADAVQDWVTTGDPLAWVTPQHEAAMAQLAELGRTHPQAARLRDRPPPPPRRARPRPAPRPRPGPGSTADPPPLVPMPAAQMAQLLADNPVLQLLADELGAIVLTHGPPEG